MKLYKKALLIMGVGLSLSSCLDLDPQDQLADGNLWSTPSDFEYFANTFYGWTRDFKDVVSDGPHSDWRSDLMTSKSVNVYSHGNNAIPTSDDNYTRAYSHIRRTNLLLEKAQGYGGSGSIAHYVAEAKFFRAYSYFLLVNFFGDVPLVLTNNYEESRLLPRTAKETVYETIVDDLQKAVVYLDGSDNPNTKVTAEAATAMLARVYLYIGQWDAAAKEAGKLIPVADGGTGTKFVLEDDVNDVFLKTTREGILNLDCTNRNGDGSFQKSTMIGMFFVSASQNPTYYLSDELVADLQEDPKDLRGQNWIKCVEKDGVKGKYFPYKNKYSNDASVPSGREEYEPFLRLAEQYLIRAEARVHLKDYTGAVSDLNRIRSRAGVEPLPAMTDENKLLLAVEEERRKELFFERGHRWFDLNRTGRADAIYSKVSYKQWVPEASLWPIPESEMKANRYLEQNLGY